MNGMRAAAGRHRDDYELSGLGRIASHLKRVDEIGAQFDADDLAALTDLLGHRPDPADADAELVEASSDGPAPNTRKRWSGSWSSAARAARAPHDGVAHLPHAPPSGVAQPPARAGHGPPGNDESWPTGAIPGTPLIGLLGTRRSTRRRDVQGLRPLRGDRTQCRGVPMSSFRTRWLAVVTVGLSGRSPRVVGGERRCDRRSRPGRHRQGDQDRVHCVEDGRRRLDVGELRHRVQGARRAVERGRWCERPQARGRVRRRPPRRRPT